MHPTLLHLRFPFVYVLIPIFVWGERLAPGPWSGRTWLAFGLVHLALYPGANAYNSAWDDDEGPVGGLARPPAVPSGLARRSQVLQAAGAALAPLVGIPFTAAYVLLWIVFTAYSRPWPRWKRFPFGSLTAIVAGQGGIGFALGWTAAGGSGPGASGVAGLVASCATVAAAYPITQLYQRDADRARGEITLACRLGVRGTAVWAAVGFAIASGAALAAAQPVVAAVCAGAAGAGGAWAWSGAAPGHRRTMIALYLGSTMLLLSLVFGWRP